MENIIHSHGYNASCAFCHADLLDVSEETLERGECTGDCPTPNYPNTFRISGLMRARELSEDGRACDSDACGGFVPTGGKCTICEDSR